jgi:RNA polymerase sigma-70 factor (ECF subfamily)
MALARAFDDAYARLRAPLYSFLLRLSRDALLAEDLLQETWLRYARQLGRLEPEQDPRPWLFTVARNLYRSHRRWRVLDAERLRELGVWPAGDGVGPLDALCASESERRLERALAELPLDQREAVSLCAGAGFSPAEAAAILGISAEAFRQRLSRGRAKLREGFERER